jgi:uncharacterized protein
LTSQASKLARSIFSLSRACRCPSGRYWYVSVIVAKDGRLGKRFILTSGVHGDAISSIRTVRTVIDPLDPAQISRTVTAMLSRPAVESVQRRSPNSGRGAGLIDMNREWPADENGASATSRHARLLFNRLLKLSCDLAIDFPTGMTSLEVGERTLPDVKTVMDLYPTGQI